MALKIYQNRRDKSRKSQQGGKNFFHPAEGFLRVTSQI
jgi:hypothetical protein